MSWGSRGGHARLLPANGESNGWYRNLPPPPPVRRVGGETRAHWAIVGAGCCGLAVARRLAEHRPNDPIALIEAERVGFGASGRNSGFMLNVHSHGDAKDLDVVRRNMRLWQGGLDLLRRLVREHQIQCDWSEWGRLYGAAGPEGDRSVDEMASAYTQLGMDFQPLDRDAMEGQTGSRFYSRGLKAHGSALVQPAALMRGLAASLPPNVTVYEESPVTDIGRGDGFSLACPEGTLKADDLILASGVFLPDLGFCRHRMVPVATYASLTRPLNDGERALFGDVNEFGLLPAAAHGSTLRLTRDRRLLVRNWLSYSPDKRFPAAALETIQCHHRQALVARWPSLAEVAFEHTWGGVMAFTRNDGAVFGRLEDGIHGVVTSDVSPVTRGTMAGTLLADLIVGHDSELLRIQQGFPRAGRLPPDPVMGILVNRRLKKIRAEGAVEL